ncbi:hypothetical protein CU098_001471, partial [Rhizopus stolonifer]
SVLPSDKNVNRNGLEGKYIVAIVIPVVFCFLVLPGLVWKRSKFKRGVKKMVLFALWDKRNGEPYWTEFGRLLFKLFSLLVILAYLVFSSSNIKNSSISSSSSSVPVTEMDFPGKNDRKRNHFNCVYCQDVRICLGGWISDAQNSTLVMPDLTCSVIASNNGTITSCSGMIEPLDSAIHLPLFVDQKTYAKCFLFRSDSEKFRSTSTLPTISFQISGIINYNNEAIYVSVYDPKNNPNRYIFFDEPLPSQATDKKDVETWAINDNDISDVENTFSFYAESSASVKYKLTEYKKVDSTVGWNYLGGFFPRYLTMNKLSTQHSIPTAKNSFLAGPGSTKHQLSEILISPLVFEQETVTEKRNNTVLGALGALGGIIGLLSLLRTVLFGSRPSSPWGLVHWMTSNQQSALLSQTLDDQLLYSKGDKEMTAIPLSEPVHERFSEAFYKLSDEKGVYNKEEKVESVELRLAR